MPDKKMRKASRIPVCLTASFIRNISHYNTSAIFYIKDPLLPESDPYTITNDSFYSRICGYTNKPLLKSMRHRLYARRRTSPFCIWPYWANTRQQYSTFKTRYCRSPLPWYASLRGEGKSISQTTGRAILPNGQVWYLTLLENLPFVCHLVAPTILIPFFLGVVGKTLPIVR